MSVCLSGGTFIYHVINPNHLQITDLPWSHSLAQRVELIVDVSLVLFCMSEQLSLQEKRASLLPILRLINSLVDDYDDDCN